MANYTISVQSGESSARYERHAGWTEVSPEYDIKESGSFSFQFPNLSGATIKAISVTAPITKTQAHGGYGSFDLKLGSQTLNTWVDSDTIVWSASNLSIAGKQSETLTLDLKPTPQLRKEHYSGAIDGWWSWQGRDLGRATATLTVSMSSPLVLTSPTNGAKVNRSTSVTAKWTNALIGSSATTVASQNLYWKYASESAYTSISLSKTATQYSFSAGMFKDGTVNWYVSTKDGSGNTYSSSVSNFVISNDFTVRASSPSDEAKFKRSDEITFKWSNSAMGSGVVSVTSQKLYWKYLNETSYRSIDVGNSVLSYKTRAGIFSPGTVSWYIASTDNYNYTTKSNVMNINVTNDFVVEPLAPLDGSRIAISLPNTFQWSNNMIGSAALPIKSQTLYWKYTTDSNYTSVALSSSATTYTFAANTFRKANIQWYIKATDNYNYSVSTVVQTVGVGITPTVEISYPRDVNIRTANRQIFTWEMKESILTGQKSYELQYKKSTDSTWTTITRTSSAQYHSFAENTFVAGDYSWRIKVTNNDGISTSYVTANFKTIGATAAPNITSVTNSSIPTINWQISSQDTFELEIYDNNGRIYESGIRPGTNIRKFTPNIMLLDGNYIVKMRAMNEYGYFTEWTEYAFVINAEKPEAVECVVYANSSHGVIVQCGVSNNYPEGLILFVLRRRYGTNEWDILGRLPSDNRFIDNTIVTDIKYEYALRNYKELKGFSDSNIVTMVINYKGSYIYEGDEFVQLYITEDEQFEKVHTPSKTYSYSYTIGRKYPVRESSEWMNHNTNLSCYITFEDYEKLEQFYENNTALWFKDKNFSFRCAIDSIQIRETLLGKGYSINISLARTDEDEVMLIE